eukprot:TRINITY_DN2473_c0_g2_i1.p1 TRINITY_DN2473_c0_g2~~TRINITY_DN2473_c0_g2_i1.p1  ORF type:complete len:1198 (+),score=278.77 TRINITY_DN2473_c0_g2_i1:93-3686(+)
MNLRGPSIAAFLQQAEANLALLTVQLEDGALGRHGSPGRLTGVKAAERSGSGAPGRPPRRRAMPFMMDSSADEEELPAKASSSSRNPLFGGGLAVPRRAASSNPAPSRSLRGGRRPEEKAYEDFEEVRDQLAVQARTLLGFERRIQALEKQGDSPLHATVPRGKAAAPEQQQAPASVPPECWREELRKTAEMFAQDLDRELRQELAAAEQRLVELCEQRLRRASTGPVAGHAAAADVKMSGRHKLEEVDRDTENLLGSREAQPSSASELLSRRLAGSSEGARVTALLASEALRAEAPPAEEAEVPLLSQDAKKKGDSGDEKEEESQPSQRRSSRQRPTLEDAPEAEDTAATARQESSCDREEGSPVLAAKRPVLPLGTQSNMIGVQDPAAFRCSPRRSPQAETRPMAGAFADLMADAAGAPHSPAHASSAVSPRSVRPGKESRTEATAPSTSTRLHPNSGYPPVQEAPQPVTRPAFRQEAEEDMVEPRHHDRPFTFGDDDDDDQLDEEALVLREPQPVSQRMSAEPTASIGLLDAGNQSDCAPSGGVQKEDSEMLAVSSSSNCPGCGNKYMPDSLFCRLCGHKRQQDADLSFSKPSGGGMVSQPTAANANINGHSASASPRSSQGILASPPLRVSMLSADAGVGGLLEILASDEEAAAAADDDEDDDEELELEELPGMGAPPPDEPETLQVKPPKPIPEALHRHLPSKAELSNPFPNSGGGNEEMCRSTFGNARESSTQPASSAFDNARERSLQPANSEFDHSKGRLLESTRKSQSAMANTSSEPERSAAEKDANMVRQPTENVKASSLRAVEPQRFAAEEDARIAAAPIEITKASSQRQDVAVEPFQSAPEPASMDLWDDLLGGLEGDLMCSSMPASPRDNHEVHQVQKRESQARPVSQRQEELFVARPAAAAAQLPEDRERRPSTQPVPEQTPHGGHGSSKEDQWPAAAVNRREEVIRLGPPSDDDEGSSSGGSDADSLGGAASKLPVLDDEGSSDDDSLQRGGTTKKPNEVPALVASALRESFLSVSASTQPESSHGPPLQQPAATTAPATTAAPQSGPAVKPFAARGGSLTPEDDVSELGSGSDESDDRPQPKPAAVPRGALSFGSGGAKEATEEGQGVVKKVSVRTSHNEQREYEQESEYESEEEEEEEEEEESDDDVQDVLQVLGEASDSDDSSAESIPRGAAPSQMLDTE